MAGMKKLIYENNNDLNGLIEDASIFFGGIDVVSFYNEDKTLFHLSFFLNGNYYTCFARKLSTGKWEVFDNFPWEEFEVN